MVVIKLVKEQVLLSSSRRTHLFVAETGLLKACSGDRMFMRKAAFPVP